jgi:hypothetical protein
LTWAIAPKLHNLGFAWTSIRGTLFLCLKSICLKAENPITLYAPQPHAFDAGADILMRALLVFQNP